MRKESKVVQKCVFLHDNCYITWVVQRILSGRQLSEMIVLVKGDVSRGRAKASRKDCFQKTPHHSDLTFQSITYTGDGYIIVCEEGS